MATKKEELKIYRTRRDLKRSPEPYGGIQKPSKDKPLFVIQKHAASHLHYDFRLEIGGVLKSWSVPKGPSMDPSIKRLAVPTDDHPLEYGSFEGIIPEGAYGAGTVMIWDTGTFYSIKKDHAGKPISLKKSFEMGTVEVFIEGAKLQGAYALIKTAHNWLLIKMRDEHASVQANPVNTKQKSVLTGRTMRQIRVDSLSKKKE